MSEQPDTPQARRAASTWLLPAVIIGAVVVVAGLVTMLLTTRNLPDTRTSVTADALPTGHRVKRRV
ncbi:MAG: hypothetical protein HGA45_39510, partial [Chloroflexales bacterium]|nr:hypothetical protein [Chloroflexales bacterium]